MIVEIADIRIRPGQQAAFEEAIERGLRTVHARAPGRRGWHLHRCIETPERYVLQVVWDSVEDHLAYRETPLSPELRAIIGPYFAQPVTMEHFELVGKEGTLLPE